MRKTLLLINVKIKFDIKKESKGLSPLLEI